MAVDVTSYAVLGLKPGADREAIEKAYRRLIKLHHPDRAGGDTQQAAAINRAYFELRHHVTQDAQRSAPSVAEAIYRRRANRSRAAPARRRKLPWKWLGVAMILAGLWVWRAEVGKFGDKLGAEITDAIEPATGYRVISALPDGSNRLESMLDSEGVAESIANVRSLLANGDIDAVADLSRSCHRQMRAAPSARQLDRCAAIDFTAVAISRDDPLIDDGPFSASAVTAREMSAARLLSDDYLLIEARLDQVRGRVETAIAPKPPPPIPEAPISTGNLSDDQVVRTDLPALRPD